MNNELRVFISSTFRDLQEEREHLTRKIFPEIRSLCRERGIHFTEIDLRWGLTDEDVALGQVIRTCLEEVDKCRPYFIGITGDRYGYIPTFIDIQKDPVLLEQYPWIEDAAMDQMSITEMETQYALLDRRVKGEMGRVKEEDIERARFYFRRHRESLDDDYGNDEKHQRLEAYQQRIRQTGVLIQEFRDPASLGELIYDDLIQIMKRDFADAKPLTPLEEERARHEAFSLSRRRAYIANPTYLRRLNEHAASDDPPLVIYAESGSGKSSLFAHWAEQYRRKNPETHVVEHYVGVGATSTGHYAIIRHMCMEIKDLFGREEEIPSEPEKLDMALGQWLGYADHELRKQQEGNDSPLPHPSSLVIILDGLNQLQGAALSLRWIPDVIPSSICLILSSTVESTLVELRRRGWTEYGMQALSETERDAVVVRYLAEYHKSLSREQIKRIASDYKCGHPLFLKTLLEELRLLGRHEDLERRIDAYLATTGTEDLFQRMLERMEEDHGTRAVRDVMVMLWGSRTGLTERELSEVTELWRLKVAMMVAGLEYHLVKKDGQLSFFHDYLRRAVQKRYLGDAVRQNPMRADLARYFESVALTERTALELLWQYGSDEDTATTAARDDRLAATLSRIDVLVLLYQGESRFEMLAHWAQLARRGYKPEEYFRHCLTISTGEQPANQGEALEAAAGLLESMSRWEAATELNEKLVELSRERGLRADEVQGYLGLGRILWLQGKYPGAMENSEEALRIASELDDRSGMAKALGNMGNVHYNQGRYSQAMECYARSLEICEGIGDRAEMARAICNMGHVYNSQRQDFSAMECYDRSLLICEELGDRSGIAKIIGAIGTVHVAQERFSQAMECFVRWLEISEEIGNRIEMANAIGSIGVVHSRQGRYSEAMECFNRDLAIKEECGDLSGMAWTIGRIAYVYMYLKHFSEALDCFERSIAIDGELGNLHNISTTKRLIGWLYFNEGRFSAALECFGRCISICEEIGDHSGVSHAILAIGYLHQDQGRFAEAMQCYNRCVAIYDELGNRGGALLAISAMGTIHLDQGRFSDAMECFDHWLAISEELDNQTARAKAIGNLGRVFEKRGEYERALEYYAQATEGHRAIGYRIGLTNWLAGTTNTLLTLLELAADEDRAPNLMPEYLQAYLPGITSETWRTMTLQYARECADECITISDEFSKSDTQFSGRILLERVEAVEGNVDGAVENLNAMLAEATEAKDSLERDDHLAELHYWLWKLVRRTQNTELTEEHRGEAIQLYTALFAKMPKYDYKQRIDELTSTTESSGTTEA